MKIGLFGGSFNPVHTGHIKIAEYAYKTLGLDKIYFIPAAVNPFKKGNKIESAEHRVNMLKLALENFKGNAEVSLFEIKKGGVSYTYETIRYFKNKFKNDELYFIMGSDLVSKFNKWEYIDEMVASCNFVVYKRDKEIKKSNIKKYNLKVFDNPIYPESSTAIREGQLEYTDEKVNKYIGNNFLYAKEIIFAVASRERAQHCVYVAEFAAELAKTVGYDAKVAYYAGLFHDVCKELPEDESREFLSQFFEDAYDKRKFPKHALHQLCGAYWVKHIYQNDNEEIFNSIKVHTTLDLELSLLDKIIFISDKLCKGRKYKGVQELRKIAMEDFDEGFRRVVKRCYDFNIQKGIKFDKLQEEIYQKWMK